MTKKKTTPAPKPEDGVLQVMQPAIGEIQGQDVQQFALDVADLEGRAQAIQKRADRLPKTPTEKSAQKALELVREARATKNEIADTWALLKKIQGLVKAMVGKRQVTERHCEAVIKAGTAHHTAWTQAEQRRIAEAQRQQRLAAEREAAAARQRELDAIEERAAAAEDASPDLSDREKRFVELLADGERPERAARQVGYRNPDEKGPKLAKKAKINDAVNALNEAREIRRQAAAVKEQPLEVPEPEPVEQAPRTPGRLLRSAEAVDPDALRAAVIEGKHGIPADVLTVDEVKLNSYARSIGQLIDRWPGVRYVEKRSIT